MISIEGQQSDGGPPSSHEDMMNVMGRGGINELPTAYVTSTPLPLAKAQHQTNQQHPQLPMMSAAETEKNAIISSLFEEIRLEATLFGGDVKTEEPDDDQPTCLASTPTPSSSSSTGHKKLKKRKSELALEMTADDVDDILGDSSAANNFNPKNPFGPSPSGLSNGYAESPGSSSYNSSPPLSKYSQNNQGQRNSPPTQFPNMSPYMTPQMNSPIHPQLQQQNSMTSSPPIAMHSPGQVPDFKPTIINGHVMGGMGHTPLPHPLQHHHSRLLQHQQSAPNLRLTAFDDLPQPHTLGPIPGTRPFDRSLVEEFEMCVRAVLMASHRVCCRHVYRQLTAEVSELYARVAKNQVPKKAVKKIIAARQPASPSERVELERQFKCLADGLESRQSSTLYESILHFLYKMRVAIPDVSS
uniref:Uncharacterized protein n=1 Tax=Caenorhabditis japonica TaxID=281687 RepID=A0A8R1HVA1_CAEJA